MSFFIIKEGNSQISMCQVLSEALSHVIPLNVNDDPASSCLGDLENEDACSALCCAVLSFLENFVEGVVTFEIPAEYS